MSKVSLKEQIEKVENQSLSGIYSKEVEFIPKRMCWHC